MREDHHTFEAHTESAPDNFCDQCFGYHHWNASCPEDDSVDDELIPFEQIDWTGYAPMRIELNHGGPLVHRVTAWRVPAEATDAEINAAIDWWMPATWCEHEHDCCGNYYARSAQLLGRTYENSEHEIVFVLQTHTANV
jgi:hypothetical protein